MKQIIYFFFLAIILSSCSDKPPMACNDTEIFSIINKNQISQISITNNEKIRFRHTSSYKYVKDQEGYCSCLWQDNFSILGDSLQKKNISYEMIYETNKWGVALSYVLPVTLIFLLFTIPVGIVLLFRDKTINDIQRLTYLILIILVPVLGAMIYLRKRGRNIKHKI